jgi:hypothetical protein
MKKIVIPVVIALSSLTLLSFKPTSSSEEEMVDLRNYTYNMEMVDQLVASNGSQDVLSEWLILEVKQWFKGSGYHLIVNRLFNIFGHNSYVPYQTVVDMQESGIIQSL